MAKFYHIDTLGVLMEGSIINLIHYDDYQFDGESKSYIQALNKFFYKEISRLHISIIKNGDTFGDKRLKNTNF